MPAELSLKQRRQRTIYKMEEARRIEEAKQKVLRFNEEAEERERLKEERERQLMSQEDKDAEIAFYKEQADFIEQSKTVPKHYSLITGKHISEFVPDFDYDEHERELESKRLEREREIALENSEAQIDGDSSQVYQPSNSSTDSGNDGHEEPLLEQGAQPGDNNEQRTALHNQEELTARDVGRDV